MPVDVRIAYAWGVAALVALWLAIALVSWTWNPIALVLGKDGRPSSSKLQFLLWTAAAVFSYVAVAARVRLGVQVVLPDQLIAAMGLSTATLVGAKAITTAQVNAGRIAKPAGSESGIVTNDSGDPDFAKAQMLAWTFIAIVAYLLRVRWALDQAAVDALHKKQEFPLPPIEASLVFLSGIGQAAYLGKKLVTSDAPRLTGIVPVSGRAPLPVTITGTSLGGGAGAAILIDGAPVQATVVSWTDGQIALSLPGVRPDGSSWPKDRPVQISVVTGGRPSSNAIPFTFA